MERMIDQETLEWLAELVDRDPTTEEQTQLDANPHWRDELEALRRQSEALGNLPRMQPPRGDWQMLEARLTSEGLIRHEKNKWLSLPLNAGWTRVAAAAALFIGGAATGLSVQGNGVPATALTDPASVQTIEQAEQVVEVAEQQYMNSLLRYQQLRRASNDWTPMNEQSRTQALDLLVQAGQSALRQAPDDPFINVFLLNTLAARRDQNRNAATEDNWF